MTLHSITKIINEFIITGFFFYPSYSVPKGGLSSSAKRKEKKRKEKKRKEKTKGAG